MADDPLSAAVEKIKDDHRQHVSANYPAPGICVSRCPQKWPCPPYRAADALGEVLKTADEWAASSGTRPLTTRAYAAECFRAAITRALTGEGKTSG